MKIDTRTIEITHKFQLTVIRGLDNKRPYVLLCQDKKNKKYALKTDHFEDEAQTPLRYYLDKYIFNSQKSNMLWTTTKFDKQV